MSNPTFSSGDLTREVSAPVEQFRLVAESGGKIAHAAATDFPFGVVTEAAAPEGDPQTNAILLGLPHKVRVGTSQRVVKIATVDGDTIAQGAAVYAAADGEVASTGTVKVGLADKATAGGLTRVHLFHPAAFAG
ncbi:hypothetical protein ACWIDS_16210 [Dietzia maris]